MAKFNTQKIKWKSTILPLLFVSGLALFFFSPLLLESVDKGLGESVSFASYPLELSKDSFLQNGKLTHWDSLTGSGSALFANPLQQHYYVPFAFTLLAKNAILGFRYSTFFHIVGAGLLFYSLIRLFGGKVLPALYSVLILFSSWILHFHVVSGVTPEIINYVWFPILLFALFKLFDQLDWRYSLLIGFSFSMLLLGGGLHFISFNSIILLLGFIYFPLIKWIQKEWHFKQGFAFTFINGLICILTTFCFSAVKLLPLLQQYNFVARSPSPALVLSEGRLSELDGFRELFVKLLSFSSGVEISLFILITAFAALILRRNRITGFLFLILVTVFWSNSGKRAWLDLYEFFWTFVPGLKTNSGSYKIMPLGYISLILLSALGLDSILKLTKSYLKPRLQVTLIGGILLFLIFGYMHNVSPYLRRPILFSNLHFPTRADESNVRASDLLFSNELTTKKIIQRTSGKNEKEMLNRILGQLAQQDGRHQIRIWSGVWGVVNAIYAYHYKYQLINYSLHTCVPKFYKGICDDQALHDLKSELRNIGILNGKYLLLDKILQSKVMLSQIEKTPLLEEIAVTKSNQYVIYKNKLFLERCFFPENKFILIGQSHLNENQAWEVKNLFDVYDLDPLKIGIVRGLSPYLEDYSSDFLQQFDGVILSDYKTKDPQKAQEIIQYLNKQKLLLRYNIDPKTFSSIEGYVDFSHRLYFYKKPQFEFDPPSKRKLTSILRSRHKLKKAPLYTILSYDHHKMDIQVKTFQHNTLMGISEAYSKQWKATLDNKETDLYMLDGLVRGLLIDEPGDHSLRLYFTSNTLKCGKRISLVSFLGVFLVLFRRKSISKNKKEDQTQQA